MGKKMFTILHSKICLSKPVYSMEASYKDTSYVHQKHITTVLSCYKANLKFYHFLFIFFLEIFL